MRRILPFSIFRNVGVMSEYGMPCEAGYFTAPAFFASNDFTVPGTSV